MKAVNLYVSISRIVYQLNSPILENKWTDLYRLIPYLRQSLSCAVCAKLLIDPYSPKERKCQHFVCRRCVRGKKNIRPQCANCVNCADYRTYVENRQIAIIMQCYKALCEYVMSLPVYQTICEAGIQTGVVGEGVVIPTFSLVEFIEEGANLQDIFVFSSAVPFIKKEPGYELIQEQKIKIESPTPSPPIHLVQKPLVKTLVTSAPQMAIVSNSCLKPNKVSLSSANSVNYLNNHHHSAATTFPKIQQQTVKIANSYQISSKNIVTSAQQQQQNTAQIRHPIKTVSNGSAMYSVVYTGNGNKLTIKRKTEHDHGGDSAIKKTSPTIDRQMPPKLPTMANNNSLKRRGCRCGNATPTPGKLTCCGQRCPCYVESKSCIDCKCRGCRNPHRPGGGKVRPRIPELDCYEIQMLDDVVPTAVSTTIKSADKITKISKQSLPIQVSLPQTTCTTTSQTQPHHHHHQQQHQQHQHRTFIPMKANPTTQHLVFTTNSMCEPSIVKLENMATESLIIQNAEGKLQVVNVLKTTNPTIHQQPTTTTTSSGIQQIHTITVPPPHSSNGSNSNPSETIFQIQNSTNITQIPDIDKTLPQIIMQPQSSPIITTTTSTSNHHHHHHLQTNNHHHNHHQNSSPANIITMHPIQSTTSSTTISPTTIIVSSSPNSFPTTIFSDEEFITTTTGGATTTTMPALVEVVEAHSTDL